MIASLGRAGLLGLALSGALASTTLADHESRALVRASSLDEWPYRGIVLVVTSDHSACTGFVIGRRKVATAGHCLVKDADGGVYRRHPSVPEGMTLYRAYSRSASPPQTFPACGVGKAWIHPRFVRSSASDTRYGSRDHDYAVLTTASGCRYPRDAVLPLLVNTFAGDEAPLGARTRLTGYPSDPRFANMDGLHLWRSDGHVTTQIGPVTRLYVTGYVGKGMSGGPVLRVFRRVSTSPCGRRACVVGILTECVVNSDQLCRRGLSPRGAVRITPEVRGNLRNH